MPARRLSGDHAEVAVAGFPGMDEKGRAAGTRQGGGDLAADMAGFAHAGDHDTAFAGQQQRTGVAEVGVDRLLQPVDCRAFKPDGTQTRGDEVVGSGWRCHAAVSFSWRRANGIVTAPKSHGQTRARAL